MRSSPSRSGASSRAQDRPLAYSEPLDDPALPRDGFWSLSTKGGLLSPRSKDRELEQLKTRGCVSVRRRHSSLDSCLPDSVCRRYMDERLEGEPPKARERVPLRQNKPWKPAPAPPSARASHNHQVSPAGSLPHRSLARPLRTLLCMPVSCSVNEHALRLQRSCPRGVASASVPFFVDSSVDSSRACT